MKKIFGHLEQTYKKQLQEKNLPPEKIEEMMNMKNKKNSEKAGMFTLQSLERANLQQMPSK